MPAQWTGEIVGKLHTYGITAKQLAATVGWNPKYLSAVLNGHVNSKKAETKLKEALEKLIAQKGEL